MMVSSDLFLLAGLCRRIQGMVGSLGLGWPAYMAQGGTLHQIFFDAFKGDIFGFRYET
ncbi:hypothetical protein D3C71_1917060 [compost metagenome]